MSTEASRELEAFVDETLRVAASHHYHPTTFIRMRGHHQTKEAIIRLMKSGDIQSGFKRLVELGLADWSLEAAVLKFPDEFPRPIREAAEFRMRLARGG